MIDTKKLREIAEKATPGEWIFIPGGNRPEIAFSTRDGWGSGTLCRVESPNPVFDGQFLVAAQPRNIIALLDEVTRCHARLEIDCIYQTVGKEFGKVAVPYAERGSIPDGIECRDETIRLQDEQIKALRTKLDQVEGLLRRAGGALRPFARGADLADRHAEIRADGPRCTYAVLTDARAIATEIEETLNDRS